MEAVAAVVHFLLAVLQSRRKRQTRRIGKCRCVKLGPGIGVF